MPAGLACRARAHAAASSEIHLAREAPTVYAAPVGKVFVRRSLNNFAPSETPYTTAELDIHIVRAASQRTAARHRPSVHANLQFATAEARIVGADGKLYAHGGTTCLVFAAAPS